MSGRQGAYLYGLEAEWLAAVYLRCKGYRILARRFKAAGGEIDLIARRGGALIFVEVKARAGLDDARITISADKRRRLAQAARAYLGRLDKLPRSIRIDAVFVAPNALPRHELAIAPLEF